MVQRTMGVSPKAVAFRLLLRHFPLNQNFWKKQDNNLGVLSNIFSQILKRFSKFPLKSFGFHYAHRKFLQIPCQAFRKRKLTLVFQVLV